MTEELSGPENENKFILACDIEDDDTLSVTEVAKAFPPDTGSSIVEQVKKLKSMPHR